MAVIAASNKARLTCPKNRHQQDPQLAQHDQQDSAKIKQKPSREWMWWTAVAIFIAGTIVFLVVIDSIYAGTAYRPSVLPDAVGK
jgi:hypothetical protein